MSANLNNTSTVETENTDTIEHLKINWMNASFLTALPIVSITCLIFYTYHNGIRFIDILNFFLMYSFTGIAITAGYHRYFSHKTYECNKIIQFLYAAFGAAALENTILAWSADHRTHHQFVDSKKDPYNIKKGFFWAHMGWIYFDDPEKRTYTNVPDLKKNKIVMFQEKYYFVLALLFGFGLPMLIGAIEGRPWGGLIWGGIVRQLCTHHSTFLINSAAHVFGTQPYSKGNSARDSWWLALFSFGEGYHNFHHTFPADYRNGLKWYQWDPTKWLIKTLSLVKLSENLRKTPEQIIQKAKLAVKQMNPIMEGDVSHE